MPRRIGTPRKERMTLSASVSPALAELVANRADELGLKRSGFIALALADYLSDFGRTPELADLEAMQDAYSDAHEGEQLMLGYSDDLREQIQRTVDEILAAKA